MIWFQEDKKISPIYSLQVTDLRAYDVPSVLVTEDTGNIHDSLEFMYITFQWERLIINT